MPGARSLITDRSLLALLALTLLFKALVPVGWMPAFGTGTVTLRLCSGLVAVSADHPAARLQQLMIERDPGTAPDHRSSGDDRSLADQPCSFAVTALAIVAGAAFALAAPLLVTPPAILFPPAVAVGRGLAAPPPRSTGPPNLS